MDPIPYTTLGTISVVAFTVAAAFKVERRRAKLGLEPPAMTGDRQFELAHRVHANTIEQLVIFLPPAWLAAFRLGDVWAGSACAIWVLGRILYARAMASDPGRRAAGMLITFLPTFALACALLIVTLGELSGWG